MKRKRHHIEESYSHNNDGKKLRFENTSSCPFVEGEKDSSTEKHHEEFVLTREIADGAILTDITGSKWRLGGPIGKGSFGEIFLASSDIRNSVDVNSAHFVTKIEPHSNGPLFVEIHCLLNVNKNGKFIDLI